MGAGSGPRPGGRAGRPERGQPDPGPGAARSPDPPPNATNRQTGQEERAPRANGRVGSPADRVKAEARRPARASVGTTHTAPSTPTAARRGRRKRHGATRRARGHARPNGNGAGIGAHTPARNRLRTEFDQQAHAQGHLRPPKVGTRTPRDNPGHLKCERRTRLAPKPPGRFPG